MGNFRNAFTFSYIGIFISLVFFGGSDSTDYSCYPDTDCKAETVAGTKVPDPLDCEKYYVCLGSPPFMYPSDAPLSCPTGEYFDQTLGDCTQEGSGGCTNLCYEGPNLDCKLNCTTSTDILGDPNECNKYYMCTPSGVPEEHFCTVSPNLYFDGIQCQDDIRNCCDFCDAYCDDLLVQIRDPHDCQRFYICTEEGFATEDMHSQCPEGQHFDAEIGFCAEGSNCSNLCTT